MGYGRITNAPGDPSGAFHVIGGCMGDLGYTPVFDGLVSEYNRTTAQVYGIIWRRGATVGHSWASHEDMAKAVGIGLRTFTRGLKVLIKDGHITDLTPDVKNRPHQYETLTWDIQAHAVCDRRPEVGQGDPPPEVGHSDLALGQGDLVVGQGDLVVGHSDLRRTIEDTKEETSKDTNMPATQAPVSDPPRVNPFDPFDDAGRFEPASEDPPIIEKEKPPRPDQVFFAGLAAVCDYDPATITDEQRGQLNQASGILRKRAHALPADLDDFRLWWDANDWRGKKGESPRPDQVRCEWGRYVPWLRRRREFQAQDAQARNERSNVSEDPVDPNLQKALDTWSSACEFLKGSLPKTTYGTYIAPLEVMVPNGTFRLGCRKEGVIEWLTNRLDRAVRSALHGAVGRAVDVEYILIAKTEG